MNVDERMERLYERIKLVRGAGDRRRGQLCLMSFVALLGGEEHTDDPRTASTMIRRYGITINDEMPADIRQRLKPFAPRILGTRDGNDRARAQMLLEAWHTEVLPRLAADFGQRDGATDGAALRLLSSEVVPLDPTVWAQVASSVAQQLAHCAAVAPACGREWYWLKAVDLLDRLCDVGGEAPRLPLNIEQVSLAEKELEKRPVSRPRNRLAVAALARIQRLIPALAA